MITLSACPQRVFISADFLNLASSSPELGSIISPANFNAALGVSMDVNILVAQLNTAIYWFKKLSLWDTPFKCIPALEPSPTRSSTFSPRWMASRTSRITCKSSGVKRSERPLYLVSPVLRLIVLSSSSNALKNASPLSFSSAVLD